MRRARSISALRMEMFDLCAVQPFRPILLVSEQVVDGQSGACRTAEETYQAAKALLAAVPIPDAARRNMQRQLIKGEVTSPIDPAPGCRFATRCPYATGECLNPNLGMTEINPGHYIRCCHPLD